MKNKMVLFTFLMFFHRAKTSLSPQCKAMMVDGSDRASRTVLLSLFWALQGSLLTWCYLQLKVGSPSSAVSMDLARDVLAKCECNILRDAYNLIPLLYLCTLLLVRLICPIYL